MDRIVARMNIARFRKLLAEERDGRKWQTIRLLLEEEERKLAAQTKVTRAVGLYPYHTQQEAKMAPRMVPIGPQSCTVRLADRCRTNAKWVFAVRSVIHTLTFCRATSLPMSTR